MATSIKDIPVSELPRERLLAHGKENLSNEELLSILLRTGVSGNTVSDLSKEILSKVDNIKELKDLRFSTLKAIRGLGTAKAVTVLAAIELGRRIYEEDLVQNNVRLKTPVDVYRNFKSYIVHEKQENFMVILVDNHRRHISHQVLFKGTLNTSIVHPREVFKSALLDNAAGIIVMHNHPSGIPTPSSCDDETTKSLLESGSIIGIPLLDHIIVGNNSYYSYVEEGRIVHE